MKKAKRMIAMLIAMVMILGMTVTAFADPVVSAAAGTTPATGTSADKGTITVKGVTAEEGKPITVKAYKIAAPIYVDANGDGTQTFDDYANDWGIANLFAPTASELANIANGYMANGTTAKALPSGEGNVYTMDPKTGEAGTYEKEVGVGMYLVMVEGSEAASYNPAVVSVSYTNSEGNFVLAPGTVDMVNDGTTWVKKSDAPSIDKVIGSNKESGKTYSTGNIGDEVPYVVTIDPIPSYEGKHPKLNVVDTLSEGLTYKFGTLQVSVKDKTTQEVTTLTANTDYEFDVNNNVITVDFVVGNADTYTLNPYHGQELTITYIATINDKAKVNEIANGNKAVLNYTKDSKTDGHDDSEEDKTYTYVFDIDGKLTGTTGTGTKENKIDTLHILNKLGEEIATETKKDANGEVIYTAGEKIPLQGAEFTLYKDYNCTQKYTNTTFNGVVSSDDLGSLHMTGLAADTYYLKETKAPGGYSLNDHVFTIEISYEKDADGKMTSWAVKIDNQPVASFAVEYKQDPAQIDVVEKVTRTDSYVKANKENHSPFNGFDIENTKISNLPSTGGIGTYIFTVVGIIIMAVSAGYFFVSRRRTAK